MKLVSELRDSRQGRGAVIVGASPSLIQFDWRMLDGLYTIALNRAVYAPSDFSVWFYSEAKDIFRGMLDAKSKETIHICRVAAYNPDYLFYNGITMENAADRHAKSVLYCRQSVTIGALDFCWLLGCNEVGLLGVDFLCFGDRRYFDETAEDTAKHDTETRHEYAHGVWYTGHYKRYARAVDDICKNHTPFHVINYSDMSLLNGVSTLPRGAFSRKRDKYVL